jgi:hypothetical protein
MNKMKKKIMYSIMVGIAVSTVSTFAAEKAMDSAIPVSVVSAEDIESTGTTSVADLLERIEALEVGAKKSNWSGKVKIKGDLRYRFEVVKKDDDTSKNRQRIRGRIGAYADVNDVTTAGIRIRTGESANSGNQTIGDHFDGKEIFFDLAYIAIAPEDAKYGTVTLGKMKYPWKVTTDLIWDGDVNPEGIAYAYSTKLDKTGLFGSAGYFKVEDSSSTHDLNLASGQLGISQPLGEKTKLTLGGSYFHYDNATDFVDPNTGANELNYAVDYHIAEGFAELGVKDLLPVPIKFFGNYVNNVDIGNKDEGYSAGIKFADAKKGKWEAKIEYRDIDENAAPSYIADSDFGGGGTDIKGARLKTKYNLFKNLQVGITYISGEKKGSDTDIDTLHLDLIAKF